MTSRERELGVIEAIVSARDQCPNASVRAVAARALESVSGGGAAALRREAFHVLAATTGWRGEQAERVRRALRTFTESPD